MLSLYGSSSMLSQKSKKKKLDEITGLQYRRTNAPAPNLAILDKLRLEMRELNRYFQITIPSFRFLILYFYTF